jgi:hypothetical protein
LFPNFEKKEIKSLRNLLLLIFFLPLFASAQILDDSTRQVYSYKSVGYRVEKQLFLNDTTYNLPDSTLGYFQRMSPNEKAGYKYQDLGNIGTAARSIDFEVPESAGIQFGFNAFELYRLKKEGVKYYNTRSPYTRMEYQQINRGGAYFDFVHSQNVTKDLNLTLDVNRTASSKQINPGTNREERLLNGWNVIFSTNYVSKDKKYNAVAHLNHFNFQQIEQGGILYDRDQSYFPIDSVTLFGDRISNAKSRTFKNTLYSYQQLKLASGFDAFHQLELRSDSFGFADGNVASNADSTFYNFIPVRPDIISWRSRNYVVQNTFGLKGYYKGFLANTYAKHRFVTSNFRDSTTLGYDNNIYKVNEFLIGGGIKASFRDSLFVLNANTEININQGGFVLNGNLSFKNFRLGAVVASTLPNLIFQRFQLPNYSWNNKFLNQNTTEFSGSYNFTVNRFQLRPYAKYQLIDNYLYFGENALPTQQTSGTLSILTMGLQGNFKLGEFYFDNNLKINASSSSVFPIPTVENNFLVYFKFNYAKALDLQVGLDNFYKSSYNAPAYNPIIQQFYLQNNTAAWGYNLTDAFVSFMVRKVKLSLKFGHVNAGVFPRVDVLDRDVNTKTAKALILTPDYPALRRSFNIHVLWPLFD